MKNNIKRAVVGTLLSGAVALAGLGFSSATAQATCMIDDLGRMTCIAN